MNAAEIRDKSVDQLDDELLKLKKEQLKLDNWPRFLDTAVSELADADVEAGDADDVHGNSQPRGHAASPLGACGDRVCVVTVVVVTADRKVLDDT